MDQLNVQQTCPPVPGLGKVGTDTIEFIFHKENPIERSSTYVISVCDSRPQKTET